MEKDSRRRAARPPGAAKADQPRGTEAADRANVASEAAAAASAPAADRASGMRFCVVEDSYKNLRAIFRACKESGHDIDHFSGAADAIVALDSRAYDVLIVSDTAMGGPQACEQLIAQVRGGGRQELITMPIIALPLDGGDARRRELQVAGASAVLTTISAAHINEALRASENEESAVSPPVTKRVLLVEDSYSLSLVLSQAFASGGHELDHVVSVDEALELIRSREYDFYIVGQSDAASVNSAQLLERIRAAQRRRGKTVPVIVLTSNAAPTNVQALRDAGADLVLTRNAKQLDMHLLAWLENGLPDRSATANPRPAEAPAAAPSPQFSQIDEEQIDEEQGGEEPSDDLEPQNWEPSRAPPFGAELSPPEPAKKLQNRATTHSITAARRATSGQDLFFFVGVFVALVGVALIGWFGWQYFADKIPVEVTTAKLGNVTRSVAVTGQVASKRQVDLPATSAGQLFRVYAEEGGLARKGEKLAALDNREALINVRRTEAQVFRYHTEIELADRALTDLRAQSTEMISQTMVSDIKANKSLAQSKLKVAEQDLQAAQLVLDRLTIAAPFAGVIARSYAIEGRWVEAGTPVFTLADIDALEVALRVRGDGAQNLQVGQTIRFADAGGLTWSGTIQHLSDGAEGSAAPHAKYGSGVVAIATLNDDAPPLALDQHVSGEVITEAAANSVTVPFEAVVQREGRDYVAVVDGAKVHFAAVEVGARNLSKVAIVNGLIAGDQVILPREPLSEGQRIAPTTADSRDAEDVEGYPHRSQYADVEVFSTEQLRQRYDEVHIVDVRSKFEFDVVHIAKAENVPVADEKFLHRLEQVRAKVAPTPLVFYCNGHSCSKSYEAAHTARRGGFNNVYAYDSGIFDWMREQQQHTALLGIAPAPLNKMVSEDYFQARMVSWDTLQKKAKEKNTIVLDVRDALQRHGAVTTPHLQVPLDDFVARLDGSEFRGKQLLIIDAVGKQVRWLQYVLEHKGYKNYFFLRDGWEGAARP